MHPVMIVIPAAILILGPRAWASYLIRKHDDEDLDVSVTAREFAREILDREHLQAVKVESTDIGDHYDQSAKAVRLARSRLDRKTLSALTTTAHEVAHALQDASDYPPFVWRTHLTKLAQVTGQMGAVVLVTVPMLALTTQRPLPFRTLGAALFAMLGTGLVAQLAALPSELDASFKRALPMLRRGYIAEKEVGDARLILVACSTTYIAASMVSILSFWPWYIRSAFAFVPNRPGMVHASVNAGSARPRMQRSRKPVKRRSALEPIVRQVGKPLIRGWLRLRGEF
ncbi:MAG: zinc metallopeptidase [Sedimenticolaceae bacterium]